MELTYMTHYSPEWKRTDAQIFGPGETYKWESSWTFGLL
jgi:hypothetical protein